MAFNLAGKSCQEYLRIVSSTLTPSRLAAADAVIVVIGHGDPALIPHYADMCGGGASTLSYPIYTDPRRRLFGEFGLASAVRSGTRQAFRTESWARTFVKSWAQVLSHVPRGLAHKPGNGFQVGGEFLYRGGTLVWCRRMTTVLDHTDPVGLAAVLGVK